MRICGDWRRTGIHTLITPWRLSSVCRLFCHIRTFPSKNFPKHFSAIRGTFVSVISSKEFRSFSAKATHSGIVILFLLFAFGHQLAEFLAVFYADGLEDFIDFSFPTNTTLSQLLLETPYNTLVQVTNCMKFCQNILKIIKSQSNIRPKTHYIYMKKTP